MNSTPIRPIALFLEHLGGALIMAQSYLSDMGWWMKPSSCYQFLIELIDFMRDKGAPSFNQPAWGMLQEILAERKDKLLGTPKDEYLSQMLDDWRDFDIMKGNRSFTEIVQCIPKHNTPLVYAAGSLEHEIKDADVDLMGRSVTMGEAANILWHFFNQVCRLPFMQMRHPQVPRWTVLRPWAKFVRDELYELREELKDKTPAISGPIGTTPFSMPGE